MGKKNKQPKESPAELAIRFSDALEENEEHMGEGAAMAVTCEQFGVDWCTGHEILMDHPDSVEIQSGQS